MRCLSHMQSERIPNETSSRCACLPLLVFASLSIYTQCVIAWSQLGNTQSLASEPASVKLPTSICSYNIRGNHMYEWTHAWHAQMYAHKDMHAQLRMHACPNVCVLWIAVSLH